MEEKASEARPEKLAGIGGGRAHFAGVLEVGTGHVAAVRVFPEERRSAPDPF